MKTNNLLCIVLMFVGLMSLNCAYAEESNKNIIVRQVWVRAMPPSQKTTAAYMTIENHSDKELILESASTDVAAATEIHQMSHAGGMMRMKMLKNLKIPANGQVVFESEGVHLMLINLKKNINKGDIIAIVLNFSDGSRLTVDADVRDEAEDERKEP